LLEEPDVSEAQIRSRLVEHYGLTIAQIVFLPIGADKDTAVYRVVAGDQTAYFLKLRRGDAEGISAILPKFLNDQGVKQIIAPIETSNQRLPPLIERYKMILFPYVEGRSGFDVELSDRNWAELGAGLKAIHTVAVPHVILKHLPRETFSAHWRDLARLLLAEADEETDDPLVAKRAEVLRTKHAEILSMVTRAERLATKFQGQSTEFVLCHGDIHAGNVLMTTNNELYIVDWDTAILAPKERDLMFIGAGVRGTWNKPKDEVLFYQAYGQTKVNRAAIAYYRYERTVEDIVATSQQIQSPDMGREDREEGLQQLIEMFAPNDVVDMAFRSEEGQSSGFARAGR
jgi:spectinomycin phosphotransferase